MAELPEEALMRIRETERVDTLAFLDRRIANHDRVASNLTGSEERAGWLARELRIVRDHVAAGLHEGEAELVARTEGS